MFETIREIALEQLAVRGEVERRRAGHLADYLSVQERAEWEWRRVALENGVRNSGERRWLDARLGDGRGRVRCWSALGWWYYHFGTPQHAAPVFDASLACCRTLDVPAGAGWSLVGLGRIA